jgi:hypothetical protein
MNHLEKMHVPYQFVEPFRNLGKACNGLLINRLVEVTASRGCNPAGAPSASDRNCHFRDKDRVLTSKTKSSELLLAALIPFEPERSVELLLHY